jgi:Zn-dependent M16 (insulinase) family peptidase
VIHDPEILPKVELEDIADDLKIPSGDFKTIGNLASTWFASGTNGMVYQKIIIELPEFELLRQTLEQARFDELPRLRELISQIRVETENSITSRGHQLVMTASSSGLSPAGKLSQQWYGLEGIQKLKQLDKSLEDETELKSFAIKLAKSTTNRIQKIQTRTSKSTNKTSLANQYPSKFLLQSIPNTSST